MFIRHKTLDNNIAKVKGIVLVLLEDPVFDLRMHQIEPFKECSHQKKLERVIFKPLKKCHHKIERVIL